MGLHTYVVPRLAELLVVDYIVDEEMFEERFAWHLEWLIREGALTLIKYLAQDNPESHYAAAVDLVASDGFDFVDIASRHCILLTGLEPISLEEFSMRFGVFIDD